MKWLDLFTYLIVMMFVYELSNDDAGSVIGLRLKRSISWHIYSLESPKQTMKIGTSSIKDWSNPIIDTHS
jgi:hypothetical protein